MWVRCGMPVKAAEEAFRVKDLKRLEALKGKASGNPAAAAEIERMIARLKGSGR